MTKLKAPIFSLKAAGRLGKLFSLARRSKRNIIERRPVPTDAKSPNQLFFRHMFTKCIDLWHLLSEAEKQEWESSARPRHMTGYAWYMSQCLRPNPGIYLPLQGGAMQGIIDMEGFQIEDLPDPTNPQDADTQAARDAAIAAALADCIDSHIHGWDGANWQKLLVESAAFHNLRVRLYAAGSEISSGLLSATTIPDTARGLVVNASLRLADTANVRWNEWRAVNSLGDGILGGNMAPVGLWGYNSAAWDRLRSWGTGILKIGRAEIGLLDLRRVNAGQVKAGAGKLYWMTMNPTAANSVLELTDDLDGSTAIKWDMTHGVNSAHHMNLDPPLEFSTGIWCKTMTNFTSVIFGFK